MVLIFIYSEESLGFQIVSSQLKKTYFCNKLKIVANMFALFKKELSLFFSSLIGFIVIVVFLLATGLFLWVFDGELNILNGGYASLEGLFFIAPWVFLFLVPAITMRLISDEAKSGTLELLFTRPISDFQIIMEKYLAGVVLILLSIIPTLIFYFSVYALGDPIGSIDSGATWGSYIGLFFLASIYAAIGLFASSLTENQIVAFILAMALCFVFYAGFDSLALLSSFKDIKGIVADFGISEHYRSISRGVMDTRDIIYFISVDALFLFATKTVVMLRRK